MIVNVQPLKSGAVSSTHAAHTNDVIQLSGIISFNDDFYNFPKNFGTSSSETNNMDRFLLSLNCTGEWNNHTSCQDNSSSFTNNSTSNSTNNTLLHSAEGEQLYDVILMSVTSVFLGLMILITIIGNVFVIAAILLQRNLQNVANYLIVSLAVADLMVACLVMPFGAIYEISQGWSLGPEYCDMWTSSDVLCCTASILHLVAIAVDRYWAVTNVDYIHTRNGTRIGIMIVLVWGVALIVSLAPQFGWKDDQYLVRIEQEKRCLPSQDIGYQIFATFSTFYVPLLVILILYWKIFQTARKRIHRRRDQRAKVPKGLSKTNNNLRSSSSSVVVSSKNEMPKVSKNFLTKRKFLRIKKCSKKKAVATEVLVSSLALTEAHSTTTDVLEDKTENGAAAVEETTAFTISKNNSTTESTPAHQPDLNTPNNVEQSTTSAPTNGESHQPKLASDIHRVEILTKDPQCTTGGPQHEVIATSVPSKNNITATSTLSRSREKKESLEAKRERKAAKTLAIITGAFVMCWLPFFVMALVMPLCSTCRINESVASVFLWLGYFNSTLNPVIYTIFSPEFRQAFTRILCGAKRARSIRNFRSGKR